MALSTKNDLKIENVVSFIPGIHCFYFDTNIFLLDVEGYLLICKYYMIQL